MLEFNTCKEAEIAAQRLQLYYFGHCRESNARIPTEFATRALKLILYLLQYMKPSTEHYLRRKLEIKTPSLSEGIREAMSQQVSCGPNYAVLEHDLRVVVALLRDAQTLTLPQLGQVGTLLGPLWDYRSENAT